MSQHDSPSSNPTTSPIAGSIISLRFATESFADQWGHCSQVANYLARYCASHSFDPERLSMALSALLNEALELAFRVHRPGEIEVSIAQKEGDFICAFLVPIDETTAQVYAELGERLEHTSARDVWTQELRNWLEQHPPYAGLIEVAAVYDASVTLSSQSAAHIQLQLRTNLDAYAGVA